MKYWPEILACLLLVCGQWWLVGWCVLSAALCGLSYLWIGPAIFQKNKAGEIPPHLLLIHRPWFWEYTVIVSIDRWLGFDGANEISPGLWLGRRLLHRELPAGIALVVDLTAEFPRMEGLGTEVDYICLPTLDGCAPEPEAFKELVDFVASYQGPILIHCARGHGRSATVMAAVLIRRGLARDLEDAYALMKSKRAKVHLHSGQKRLLNSMS